MARIRTIKPEFFRNGDLYRAEKASGFPLRVAFAGLWTSADREGRFRWRPDELKLDALPHDQLDFEQVLVVLERGDYIRRYVVEGKVYGYIPTWSDHQAINNKEMASVLPAPLGGTPPSDPRGSPDDDAKLTRGERVDDAGGTRAENFQGEGKGREGKGREGESAPTAGAASAPTDFTLAPVNGKAKNVVGGSPITIKSWFARCKEANVDPIPVDDPVFAYALKAKLPAEFVTLAWKEFRRKHIDTAKKQANWRQAFRNYVEGNYYKLWFIDERSDYALTSAGKQAQKVHSKAPPP